MKLDYVETNVLEEELSRRKDGELFVLAGDTANTALRIERMSYGFNFKFTVKVLGFRPTFTGFMSTDDMIRLESWLKGAISRIIKGKEF
jgi:hypothetical protein